MARNPLKLLAVAGHPVQYATPQFKALSARSEIDLTVAYADLAGVHSHLDAGFGRNVKWDQPLLEGHHWVHVGKRGLWNLIRESRFDVVVCYGYRQRFFWTAIAAAKTTEAKTVVTTDAHQVEGRGGGSAMTAIKRQVLPRFLKRVDAVFAPSTRTVRFLRGLGLTKDQVFLTPFVVDNEFFSVRATPEAGRELRKKLGISEDSFVALFAGKLAPWKRPQDVIEAAFRVPGVHVLVAGDGVMRESLEELAQKLSTANRTHFVGFLNQGEMPAAYAASDLLIVPSEFEPFGVVVNEAFAAGIPAIVSNACGCAEDLVKEGNTGMIFPAGDVPALTNALGRLAADRARTAQLGGSAKNAIAGWDLKRNVNAVVQACLAMTDGRPS